MGLLNLLFGNSGKSNDRLFDDKDKNDDWFDHSGEDHDNEDGWCTECEEDEEDLED